MLQKIVVLIGSLLCSAMVLAEDAPLPFDDPAAAPPIVRKASPVKVTPAVVSSKVRAKPSSKALKKNTAKSAKSAKNSNVKHSKYKKSTAGSKRSLDKSSNKVKKGTTSVKKRQVTTPKAKPKSQRR